MKKHLLVIIAFISLIVSAQENLDALLNRHNTKNIPYIAIHEMSESISMLNPIILDAREPQEFNISHIKNAIHVGFDEFNIEQTIKQLPNKNQTIIVYCSIGIRSETIAHQLREAGYINVKNLYGGIFEWKNQKHPVYNINGIETDSLHAFSKQWSKWLKNGIKVYK